MDNYKYTDKYTIIKNLQLQIKYKYGLFLHDQIQIKHKYPFGRICKYKYVFVFDSIPYIHTYVYDILRQNSYKYGNQQNIINQVSDRPTILYFSHLLLTQKLNN